MAIQTDRNLPRQLTAAISWPASPRWRDVGAVFSLCLLILITFVSGIHNKPVAEDFIGPEGFLKLGDDRQFRPVFALIILALRSLAGSQTQAYESYHIFSLTVHIVATLSVFMFIRLLISSRRNAFIVALLFAVYPRHHEPVFWPIGAFHSLMTACLLLSFCCYLKARQNSNRMSMAASVILFGLGLLSSEAGAAGIVLFLAYEVLWHTIEHGQTVRQWVQVLLLRLAPFAAVIGAYGIVLVLGSSGLDRFVGKRSDTHFYHLSLGPGLIKDFGGYLSYTIFPFVPLRSGAAVLTKFALVFITLMLLTACLVWGSRLVRFGVVWIVATVLPYVLLVPYGNADRYFYLPSIGACLIVFGLYQSAAARVQRQRAHIQSFSVRVIGIICLAVYLVLAMYTLHVREGEWRIAGEMVNNILIQIYSAHPTVQSNTTMIYVNLPQQYKQARVLGVGLQWALRAHYNDQSLRVNELENPELQSILEQTAPGVPTQAHVYIYVYHDGALIDYSDRFAVPQVRALLAPYTDQP